MLPMVVAALLRPSAEMAAGVSAESPERFAEANREVALALQRLCEGDLRGMFDGPTSAGLDLEAPLVVLDLSAVQDSAALGILMTCAAAWMQGIVMERRRAAEAGGGAKMIIALDEGWRVASHIGVAEWLQQSWKLCRANGVQNIIVLHRLSDLGAAGAAGSREARIAEGLIADSDTKVIYAQSADQLGALREMLGLSETEAELLPTLRGRRGALGGRAAELSRPAPALGARARAGRHRRPDAQHPARGGVSGEGRVGAWVGGLAAALGAWSGSAAGSRRCSLRAAGAPSSGRARRDLPATALACGRPARRLAAEDRGRSCREPSGCGSVSLWSGRRSSRLGTGAGAAARGARARRGRRGSAAERALGEPVATCGRCGRARAAGRG